MINIKPLVSIIIPFYNTPEKAFQRCINSLKMQTFSDFETIVINDGSADDCLDYFNLICGTDNRIRIINKNNEGSAIARNIGIGEAKGEYILFLDSDDALTDFCLEEAAQIVRSQNPDLIIGAVKRVSEDEIDKLNPIMEETPAIIQVRPGKERDSLMSHMIGHINAAFLLKKGYIGDGPVARLLRKTIAVETLFSTEAFWSDDTIWNCKMLKKCEHIVIVDDLWYKYLIYAESKTRRYRPDCPYEFDYRTKQQLDLFKELWPHCMEGVYTRIFNDITILCRTYLFHPDNPKSNKEKFLIYKKCIHNDAYREALQCMDLRMDKRIINRTVKELLRFTALYGPNVVSYWILKLFYDLRKNTL